MLSNPLHYKYMSYTNIKKENKFCECNLWYILYTILEGISIYQCIYFHNDYNSLASCTKIYFGKFFFWG